MPDARSTFVSACREAGFLPTEAEIAAAKLAVERLAEQAPYYDTGPRQVWAALEAEVTKARERRA